MSLFKVLIRHKYKLDVKYVLAGTSEQAKDRVLKLGFIIVKIVRVR